MGKFTSPIWMTGVGSLVAIFIVGLNCYLLMQSISWIWLSLGVAAMSAFALWAQFGYKEKKSPAARAG